MRLLGLLDDEGRHQPTFARLGRSTTVEYPTVLGEILKEAYAPVFQIIDPATASEVEITDAFRSYQPQGQRDRMIKLFVGLCREAGLMPGGPPETISRAKKVPAAQPKPAAALPPRRPAGRGVPAATPLPTRAYEQVEALVRHLPPERRWTPARRNRWLQAVTATVDLLIELEGPERQLPLQLPGATDDGRTVESSVGQTS